VRCRIFVAGASDVDQGGQGADPRLGDRENPSVDERDPVLGKVLANPTPHPFPEHSGVERFHRPAESARKAVSDPCQVALVWVVAEILPTHGHGAVHMGQQTVDSRAAGRVDGGAWGCLSGSSAAEHDYRQPGGTR
jgi:hypothetical protein